MEPFNHFVAYIALACAVVCVVVGRKAHTLQRTWMRRAQQAERERFMLWTMGTESVIAQAYAEAKDAMLDKWICYGFAVVFALLAWFVQP